MLQKNMTKKPLNFLAATLFLISSSCAPMPPDIPLCTELDADRAYCTYTISTGEFLITPEQPFEGKSWPEIRAASVIAPATSYAKIKAYIAKMCAKHGECGEPTEEVPEPTPTHALERLELRAP